MSTTSRRIPSDDRRLPELAKRLSAAESAGKPVFRRVITGSDLLHELCGEPLNLTRDQAVERLSGWVLGPAGETCTVAMMSPQGKLDREGVMAQVRCAVVEVGLPADALKMAGTTMESIAIDETSTKWFVELSIASAVVCIAIMYISFRSMSLVLMVYGTAVISERLSLAWMHVTSTPTDKGTRRPDSRTIQCAQQREYYSGLYRQHSAHAQSSRTAA